MKKNKNRKARVQQPSLQQITENTLKRFDQACHLLTGLPMSSLFTRACVEHLLDCRFAALRFTTRKEWKEAGSYQGILSEQIAELSWLTATGEQMPIHLFLREGLVLLFYAQLLADPMHPRYDQIKQAFLPYQQNRDLVARPVWDIVRAVQSVSILATDWTKRCFIYCAAELSPYTKGTGKNEIQIGFVSPQKKSVYLQERYRECVKVGWARWEGEIRHVQVRPSALGLQGDHPDRPCHVYIQQHALNRLRERLGLLTGLMHFAVYETFAGKDIRYHPGKENSLVELDVLGIKLGYLAATFTGSEILIRTFLFLTNDGTPEAARLQHLTRIQRQDKKYLGIDSLSGFLKFKVAEDPLLRDLFAQAGCSSLLDLSVIERFFISEVSPKDSAQLLSYLMRGEGQQMRHQEEPASAEWEPLT